MSSLFASNSIYQKSPLDSLMGQSSIQIYDPPHLQTPTRPGEPERPTHNHSPSSPLLHTRFRASATTTSASFIDFRAEDEEERSTSNQGPSWPRDSYNSDVYQSSSTYDTPGFNYVMAAIGDQSPTLPPSPTPTQERWQPWSSHGSGDPTQMAGSSQQNRDTWRSSANDADPFAFRQFESPGRTVPRVVVSSPVPSMASASFHEAVTVEPPPILRATRPTPSMTQYSVSNFSRPIRQSTAQSDNSKRAVIERNRVNKQASPPLQRQDNQIASETPQSPYSRSPGNLQKDYMYGSSSPPSIASYVRGVSPPPIFGSQPAHRAPLYSSALPTVHSTSPYSSYNAIVSTPGQIEYLPSGKGSSAHPMAPHMDSYAHKDNNHTSGPPTGQSMSTLKLPNSPPSPRPASRVSLYSEYSFYQLDDDSRPSSPSRLQPESRASNATSDNSRSRSSSPSQQTKGPVKPTPDDYLLLGIQHHEANRLKESAACFERAATQDGGSGVGMLMWGLSLRHAWGTEKDEKAGFRWLRRAAEAAVGDLEAAREGKDQAAVKTELILAIYEVGQCFFHGWGVIQDKKMAVSYFQVAARLGDADAQQELGYCLANGKGCKKDLKEAAKWYRAAACCARGKYRRVSMDL